MDHQTAGTTYGTAYFIPTEDEWYKAAYHKNNGVTGGAGNYWDYPTGGNTAPTATTVANQLSVDPGSANYNGVVGSPTNVGAYNSKPSTSAYDTFDQGGNVLEWNEAVIASDRGLRGGSYYYYDNNLASSYRGDFSFPGSEYSTFGFRVASVPEPASLGLITLGGLALLKRRRR
jgi:formylglycine-generating enzyme required for sulfatase activity